MTAHLLERALGRAMRALRFGMPLQSGVPRSLHGTVTVLLYHRLCRSDDAPWLEQGGVPVTQPEAFRRQLSELRDAGGQFFTLSQVLEGAWPAADRPGFIITFDDGFSDNFSTGVPILNNLGIPAVFFITAAMPEQRSLLWEHLLFRLASETTTLSKVNGFASKFLGEKIPLEKTVDSVRSLLTPRQADELLQYAKQSYPQLDEQIGEDARRLYPRWSQLQSAIANGHQIAAHTTTHRMRQTLSKAEFEEEIGMARQILESGTNTKVTAMSYPYNAYFISDDEICRSAGYQQVATVDPGRFTKHTSPYWIPRRTIFRIHDSRSAFRESIVQEGFCK